MSGDLIGESGPQVPSSAEAQHGSNCYLPFASLENTIGSLFHAPTRDCQDFSLYGLSDASHL